METWGYIFFLAPKTCLIVKVQHIRFRKGTNMNKNESEKKPNRIRKFCSDHPWLVIGGVAALGVVSTVVAIQIAKPDSVQKDYIWLGEKTANELKKDGIAIYCTDDKLKETIEKTKEHGVDLSQAMFDYMKAATEHVTIVELEQ